MAQSGYTAIQLYSSPTPGATPAATALTNGELALNAADGKLFYKDTAGNTQVIADSAYSSGVAIQGSGTSVVGTGTVQFANSNGVTFGLNGSTMTASVASGPSIQGSGTNVVNAGTVQFANSNGVTFGLNGSTMTASVSVAPNITFSAGTASTATGSVVFASSNGISFGLTSNTITAGRVLSSYVPAAQISGHNLAETAPQSFLVAPITLTDSLAFQGAKQKFNLATLTRSASVSYAISASTAFSNYGFTQSTNVVNILYTKTGDTLSSQVIMSLPVSLIGAASMSTTTAVNTNSYSQSISQSISVVYPTSTSTNGYLFSTVSSLFSTIRTVNSNAITSSNPAITISAFTFANAMSGRKVYTVINSAPTTLAPNTYWAVNGIYTDSSRAGTNVTVDLGGANPGTTSPLISATRSIPMYFPYEVSTDGDIFTPAEAIPNNAMASTVPALSDFGMVYVQTNGASYTQSYNIATALTTTAGSYASTLFSTSGVTSIAGTPNTFNNAPLRFPMFTLQ